MNPKTRIVRGTNSKPVSSEALAKFFVEHAGYEGQLFIGYPIIGTPEGRYPIDALWVSPQSGIVIFDLIEGNDPGKFLERQDDAANKLEAKLKAHRELTRKRDLLVQIHTVSFAPAITKLGRYKEDDLSDAVRVGKEGQRHWNHPGTFPLRPYLARRRCTRNPEAHYCWCLRTLVAHRYFHC